jgi:hypothetical protein
VKARDLSLPDRWLLRTPSAPEEGICTTCRLPRSATDHTRALTEPSPSYETHLISVR